MGLLGDIYTINKICELNQILTGHVILACDGVSVIEKTTNFIFKTTTQKL